MCKPDKSFNTWVKVISRHTKNALQEQPCRRGSAPYRHSDWTSRLWAMSKSGQFKTTRESACWLFSLDSLELCGTRRSYASRFRNCALQRAPVRWTLTSEPTIGGSLRLCQSRNGATNSTIAEESFPVTSRSSLKSPHESNRRSPNRPRDTRNKELNSRGKTKQEPALNQSKQVQTAFLILTELVNMI